MSDGHKREDVVQIHDNGTRSYSVTVELYTVAEMLSAEDARNLKIAIDTSIKRGYTNIHEKDRYADLTVDECITKACADMMAGAAAMDFLEKAIDWPPDILHNSKTKQRFLETMADPDQLKRYMLAKIEREQATS